MQILKLFEIQFYIIIISSNILKLLIIFIPVLSVHSLLLETGEEIILQINLKLLTDKNR